MMVNGEGGGPLTHSQVRRDDWTLYTYIPYYYWVYGSNHSHTYMYVDNVVQGRSAWGSFWTSLYNNKLRLGSWRVTNSSYQFTGDIAEVILWNRKISDADKLFVSDRMCAKYVCKNMQLVMGNGFVKERIQKLWSYETLAVPQYTYTHPVTTRTGGKACCRMFYKAFMKGNTNPGGTANLLTTSSSPIGYHNTAR
jgi:hypothetical protein